MKTPHQRNAIAALSVALLGAGCVDSGPSSGRLPAAPKPLVVSLVNGEELRGLPASIAVTYGSSDAVRIEFSIVAGDEERQGDRIKNPVISIG